MSLLLVPFVGFMGCKKKQPPPPPPPEVRVITVNPQDVPIYTDWIGSLDGDVNARIRAQVTGYLLTRNYKEGSFVKKGDLLFQIDPRPFQAALDQAKSRLALDQAQQVRTEWTAKRFEPLVTQNAISQLDYKSAVQADMAQRAQVQSDQAQVEAAQLNLGFTRITSPIDGLAGQAEAQIGDLVAPGGAELTAVSSIDPIRVNFNASEQSYLATWRQATNGVEQSSYTPSLELHLILSDGTTYPFTGRFFFAGREVNLNTGTIQLTGLFPNPNGLLRPGQFARVRARTQLRTDALLVPQRAVNELQGTYQIAVVDAQNKVHLQSVTVGDQVGAMWLIEKGLQPGQRVVVEGTQKAKEGALVNPQPYVPSSAHVAME